MSRAITNFRVQLNEEISTMLHLPNVPNKYKVESQTSYRVALYTNETDYESTAMNKYMYMTVFNKYGHSMLWKMSGDFERIQFYYKLPWLKSKGFENGSFTAKDKHFQVIRTVFRWLLLFSSRLIAKLRQARHRILNRQKKHLFLCALKAHEFYEQENRLTIISGLDSARRMIYACV